MSDDGLLEAQEHHAMLVEQLAEYKINRRLHWQLVNDATLPGKREGWVVPQKEALKIRAARFKLVQEMEQFEQLEWFVDEVHQYTDRDEIVGYRLNSPGKTSILLVGGKVELHLQFRDEKAGTFVTFSWNLERDVPWRAVGHLIYASLEEALQLIERGSYEIEKGYSFDQDDTVLHMFGVLTED